LASENRNLVLSFGLTGIVFVAIYFGVSFLDGDKTPTPANQSIPIESWFAFISDKAPNELCKAPAYLTDCYKLDAEICQIELKSSLRNCFDNKKTSMPKTLRGPKDAAYWGSQVIECGVDKVTQSHLQNHRKDKYCRSLTAWINDRPDGKITKAHLMFSLEYELPKRLCEAGQESSRGNFFLRCFELEQEQCYDEASQAVDTCLEKYDSVIQGEVRVPVDSLPFTNTIINCSIKFLTSKFSSQKRPGCDDTSLFEKAKTPN
jgi:hypothetical protein